MPCVGILLLVYRLHELAYDERHALDALDLLLRAHQLPLQTPLLILDILFLKMDVPAQVSMLPAASPDHFYSLKLSLELLEGRVVILPICAEALERVEIRYG
jgi:hypothetical protein